MKKEFNFRFGFLFLAMYLLIISGCGGIPSLEIPMGGGECTAPLIIDDGPDYVPLPTVSLDQMTIPNHPGLAPQQQNGMHSDSYCTGTYPWAGPSGVNPQVISQRKDPIAGGMVATVAIDSKGRLVAVSGHFAYFELLLMDPDTLNTLASIFLPPRVSNLGGLGNIEEIMKDTSGGGYFHLDKDDRAIIGDAFNIIQLFSVDDTGSGPVWQKDEAYNLNESSPDYLEDYLDEDGDHISDAMPDWNGNIWFITRTGKVGVVDTSAEPATVKIITLIAPVTSVVEEIQNAIGVAADGIYIVSDHALYRFQVDATTGYPTYAVSEGGWRTTYDRGTFVKPGAINQGSGTTPSLVDVASPGTNLVAITDNADGRVNVCVYRRDTGALVCQQPVFDDGYSTSENSMIAYSNGTVHSFIVENNYRIMGGGLPTDWDPITYPGVARVDVNENCTACVGAEAVWTSKEASQTTVPKLSIESGLIYGYTRLNNNSRLNGIDSNIDYTNSLLPTTLGEQDPEDPNVADITMAWYFTAIDFVTGKTVFKIFTGTGKLWNNNWGPITIGPDGTAYVGVYNGIIAVRDQDPAAPPRVISGCN